MCVTCDKITCEKKNRLHVMGHVSHENGVFSHVFRMRNLGLRMRKVYMRTACEILNRADAPGVLEGVLSCTGIGVDKIVVSNHKVSSDVLLPLFVVLSSTKLFVITVVSSLIINMTSVAVFT